MTRLYFMDESLQESAAMFLSVNSPGDRHYEIINEDVPVMIQLVPVAYNNKSYVLICGESFTLGYLVILENFHFNDPHFQVHSQNMDRFPLPNVSNGTVQTA